MTGIEYEQKKAESWENFKFAHRPLNTDKKIFDFIFDRAYTLGKQEKGADKEEMFTCEKSKVLYRFRMAEACKIGNNPEADYWIGYSKAIQDLFGLEGEPYVTPNDADTVIQGWVCRDEDNTLTLFYGSNKPSKEDGDDYWSAVYGNALEYLNQNLFPDVKWEDAEPTKVEITIKRKKK